MKAALTILEPALTGDSSIENWKRVTSIDLDGVYYDNEQGWQLFRQLPLTDNYKGVMPVCATVIALEYDLAMM